MQKNKIILYLGEHFPQHLQRSYSQGKKKNSMHDFGLQESESHLAFKLCNFLTDDWEKNKEAANSQWRVRQEVCSDQSPRGLPMMVPLRKQVSKAVSFLACHMHNTVV